MVSDDPVHALVHDHAELNRRVLELEPLLSKRWSLLPLVPLLQDLREQMFLHFSREEEALFPLISEWFPDLADQVPAMVTAHDAICGGIARMIHAASTEAEVAQFHGMLMRFEKVYSEHNRREVELLQKVDARLDAAQRTQLAELVKSL
jgi:iron-sulfur cluster repair protein YtfE (RIC family)